MPSRNEEVPLDVELQETEKRIHVIDGLIRAMNDPRAVLEVMLEATDVDDGRSALRTLLGLDEIQANAVLDLQFRRATQLERSTLEERRSELAEHLEFLRTLGEQSPD